ncbi:MAG: hypothetical protein DRN07_07780, partial [Thermoplasmata archaeon]
MESSHHNDVTYNTINSTGWNGYSDPVSGIYLTAWASYNNITNNTVTHSGEGLSLGGHGYGIYLRDYPGLQDSGPHNNTIAGNNLSENRDCDMVNRRSPDNIYLNNTFSSYPTTANITAYEGNFTISGVSDPPAMPTGVENISKFLDITTEDYINVTIHYEDSDLADASNEGTMVIWKHNSSGPFNGWYYNGSWYGDRGIDTTANEIWVNITDSGSIFAPLQDTTPPSSNLTIQGPYWDNDGNIDIYWNASDNVNLSSVEIYWNYSSDNSSWDGWMRIHTTTVSGTYAEGYLSIIDVNEGWYRIAIWAIDGEGNAEWDNATPITPPTYNETAIDITSPETTKSVGTPTYGPDNVWVNLSTPITLSATDPKDNASGVAATYYRIWYNGGWHPNATDDYYCTNENITLYNGTYYYVYYNETVDFGPIHFCEECVHYIEFFSVDIAGNEENHTVQAHFVDNTPPEVTKEYGEPFYIVDTEKLVDQKQTNDSLYWPYFALGNETSGPPPLYNAQSFMPNATHLDAVSLYLGSLSDMNSLGGATVTVTILDSDLNLIGTSTPVYVGPENLTWYQFHFDPSITLIPGQTYYIAPTADAYQCVWWMSSFDNYSRGMLWAGGTSYTSYDYAFKTEYYKRFITKDTPIYLNATDSSDTITKLSPGVPMVWPFWEANGTSLDCHIYNFGPKDATLVNLSYVNLSSDISLENLNWSNMDAISGWQNLVSPIPLNVGATAILSSLSVTDGDAAVIIRYNVSVDGEVVARFIGEVLLSWSGGVPTITGTRVNFDVHNNLTHLVNNFELEIENITIDNITDWYEGWGWPANITEEGNWVNITWINVTDPIYPCNWTHFGLEFDEGVNQSVIEDMIANWTVKCAVGSYQIWYRVYSTAAGAWTPWQSGPWNESVIFTLADLGILDNCTHYIEYYAIDDLYNNYTEVLNQTVYVDNTAPTITITVGDPNCSNPPDGYDYCVTTDTVITINATDYGC